jgi:hypothetical protein
MKAKSQKEIDKIVISQADDESAWTVAQTVKSGAKRASHKKFLGNLNKVSKVEFSNEVKVK